MREEKVSAQKCLMHDWFVAIEVPVDESGISRVKVNSGLSSFLSPPETNRILLRQTTLFCV